MSSLAKKQTLADASSLQKAMDTLTAQWYNAVITGCSLSPETFQLVQGSQQVGTTSETLWQFFDAIPPLSVSQYFDPNQFNRFSQDYGGVIVNLLPQGSDALSVKMGDYYSQWLASVKKTGDASLKAFQTWAMGVDPSAAPSWISIYRTLLDGTIFLAQEAWNNMLTATINPGVCAYDKTIAELNNALLAAKPASVTMNSNTESTDITKTWTEGAADGILEEFFGGGEASYESLSQTIATSGLNINANFQRLLTFACGPLGQPSSDPILSSYTPWYNSKAFSTAYHENNNDVWKHGAPTWQDTFGDAGDMQRICSALVIVDGIDITMSSEASLSKDDQASFEAAAAAGFFPFFEAEVAHGWSTHTTFDDQGRASVKSSLPTGNPQVLGVIVTPTPEIFK